MIWKVDGQKEITPTYDEKGKIIPEGGVGMRYVLNKKIRLVLGSHRIFFGLPEDKYAREFDISLKNGVSILDLKPEYRRDHRSAASFLNGIRNFELFHNGVSYGLTS